MARSVNLSLGPTAGRAALAREMAQMELEKEEQQQQEKEQAKAEKKEQAKAEKKVFKPSIEEVEPSKEQTFQGTMKARQMFESKGKSSGSAAATEKIKQTIRESVRGRYLKEIKDVSPSMKEQFWQEFTRSSGKYYSGLAVKGWRPRMEDTMDAFHTRHESLEQLFAVYDGHGGSECSNYCKNYLLKRIAMHSELPNDPKAALTDSFEKIDEQFAKQAEKSGSFSGTTATVLYLCREKEEKRVTLKYYLSFVGDSRAILVYKDGSVVPLSLDHHLTRKDELERVKSQNGEVRYDSEFDETLVYNVEVDRGLAVTRSIGDADFKPIVTSTPEINEGFITEDCAFVCLASDGLWAKISNEKVGEILVTHGRKEGIDILANLANARGVFDNITIMAIECEQVTKDLL